LGKFEEVIPDNSFGLRVGRPDVSISRSLAIILYRLAYKVINRGDRLS